MFIHRKLSKPSSQPPRPPIYEKKNPKPRGDLCKMLNQKCLKEFIPGRNLVVKAAERQTQYKIRLFRIIIVKAPDFDFKE